MSLGDYCEYDRCLLLAEALKDALDGMEDMVGYVPEYFQHKWDHQGYIERARAALAEAGESLVLLVAALISCRHGPKTHSGRHAARRVRAPPAR